MITGFTGGALGGPTRGLYDAFIVKYSADGDRLWKRQLGTRKHDWSFSVATDAEGNIVIGGFTQGSLGGPTQGRYECYFAKFMP